MKTREDLVRREISRIKTDGLRRWVEAQEFPYIKTVRAILRFEEAIAENPSDPNAYVDIGIILHWGGNYESALQMYGQAVDLAPNSVHGLLSRASLLATCPDEEYRNGTQAVADSRRAFEYVNETGHLDGWPWVRRSYLEVLAASYAEIGDFEKASDTLKEALAVCKTRMAEREVRSLFETIQRGQPIRKQGGLLSFGQPAELKQ